ncbi:unnamed protein product, partial [Rotaria sp. Silwood1]
MIPNVSQSVSNRTPNDPYTASFKPILNEKKFFNIEFQVLSEYYLEHVKKYLATTSTTSTSTTSTTTTTTTTSTTTTTTTSTTTTTTTSTTTTTTTSTTTTTTTSTTTTTTTTSTTTTTTTTTVYDACAHLRWNQTGVVVAGTGSSGSGSTQFDKSACLVIDASNTLYVCDHHNDHIQRM